MQVASSEWVLGVQIQHFENMHNAEISNGNYCCCDDPYKECWKNITDLNGMCFNLPYRCQTYFVLYVRECPYSSTCSDTEFYRLNVAHTSLQHLVLYMPLEESGLSNNVRIKINYLLQLIKNDERLQTVFSFQLMTKLCNSNTHH